MEKYSYKGVGRNKTLIIKSVSYSGVESTLGTYSFLTELVWGGVTYPLLIDSELAQLPAADYNKRLKAFIEYVVDDLDSYPQLSNYNLLEGAVEGTDTFGTVDSGE